MPKRLHVYEGRDIVVRYDVSRCIHAAECVRGLPSAFDPKRRPWVVPDAAAADEVAGVVARCPSGALTFERRDGGAAEVEPARNVVWVSPDGPLHVRAAVRLGEAADLPARVALCRCGASKNKPFCDGTHREAGFRHDGLGAAAEPAPAPPAAGELRLRPLANGPVLVEGPVEVRDAAGAVLFAGSRAALCRCGGSSKKPFCDGSHKRNGFTCDGES